MEENLIEFFERNAREATDPDVRTIWEFLASHFAMRNITDDEQEDTPDEDF